MGMSILEDQRNLQLHDALLMRWSTSE